MRDDPSGLLASAPGLRARLEALLAYRLVFFAGMPATGKSLLAHQLAHLAHAAGREVHLLQWDIARPVFEASPRTAAYPIADGITHPIVRRAAGLWARRRVAGWSAEHPSDAAFLAGETPLVGNRFVELVRREHDAAEAVLSSDACRFVLTVPSDAVRRHIEAERRRRAETPLNPREAEDAPPHVLRDMWRLLLDAGRNLGVNVDDARRGHDVFDRDIYRRVYERLLRHRPLDVWHLDTVLPAATLSAYDYAFEPHHLLPTAADIERFIHQAEEEARTPGAPSVERWWEV